VDILHEIAAAKRIEIAALKQATPVESLIRPISPVPYYSFRSALTAPGVRIVGEVKQKSPSKGVLSTNFDVARLAGSYARGGAAALSVLIDRTYFGGDPAYIAQAKSAAHLPALYKEFIIDEYQLYHARACGADAVLLIVRLLTRKSLFDYLALAASLKIDCLVETHSEPEIQIALDCGATIVGINCRDLSSFEVSLLVAERLSTLIPEGVVKVAESGINGPSDITRLKQAGFSCFLVGESLVKSPDPAQLLKEMVAA
jgi:indole-3-glycerol phosphate synthase